MLYFGPEPAANDASPTKPANEEGSSSPSRRPGREGMVNGLAHDAAIHAPAAKRSRRTNGAVNGNSRPKSGESMDADHHGSSHHGEPATKRDPNAINSPSSAPPPPPPAVAPSAASALTGTEMDVDVDARLDRSMEMEVDGSGASADAANGADEDDAGGTGASHLQVQAQVIYTLTNGQSVGVQSDKVTDLGPETAVLDLLPSQNVTHVCWNPRDPTLLATGGEALCRIWTIPTSSLALTRSGPEGAVEQAESNRDINSALVAASQKIDLLDHYDSIVTAMAWSPDGESIANAVHPNLAAARGTISIRSKTGESLDELPGGHDLVLNLLWSPSGSLLLGSTHSDNENSVLMVWDTRTGRVIEPFRINRSVIDVAWTSDRTLVLCGPSFIASTAVGEHNFDALQELAEPGPDHNWSYIRYDDISHTSAIASESSGLLGLIDANSTLHTAQAHDREITALIYQPLSNPNALAPNSPRIFATAGIDGRIKLWDAKRPLQLLRTLEMGGASPVLALSFTFDGYLVAAASSDKVLFWNAEAGGLPKATWTAKNTSWLSSLPGGSLQSNGNGVVENGDVDMRGEEPTCSLGWDADGRKVAFGARDKVGFTRLVVAGAC